MGKKKEKPIDDQGYSDPTITMQSTGSYKKDNTPNYILNYMD